MIMFIFLFYLYDEVFKFCVNMFISKLIDSGMFFLGRKFRLLELVKILVFFFERWKGKIN